MSLERSGRDTQGEMRDVWCWALSWYLKSPSSPDKRAKQAGLVEAIKTELKTINDAIELNESYSKDARWCLKIARTQYPRHWPTLGLHACTATAYGLRFVEIMTKKSLDAREPLPRWVTEWAIW